MMSVQVRSNFSKAAKRHLVTLLLGTTFLQGCATTGVPDVPTTDIDDLKSLTHMSENGIVSYNGTGKPVAGVEGACRMLSSEVRAQARNNSNGEDTMEDLRKTVSKAYKGPRSKNAFEFIGNTLVGTTKATFGVIGVGLSAGGRAMDQHTQENRIEALERHCEQNKALAIWEKAQTRCLVRVYDEATSDIDGSMRGKARGQTVVDQSCVKEIMDHSADPASLLPAIPRR